MDHELNMMEAVLDDLQQCLQAEGYNVQTEDEQPTAASQPCRADVSAAQQAVSPAETGNVSAHCMPRGLSDSVALKKNTSTGCSQAHEASISQQVAIPHHAGHTICCGTDRSLADMDAVMLARGYR